MLFDLKDLMQDLRQDDGFTLLEVLISFVILSLSLGVIYQIVGSSALSSTTASNRSHAILIAKSKMAEGVLYPGVREGEEGKYRWISIVTNLNQGKDTQLRLLKIDVTVSWDEFSGMREVRVETLKLLPELRQ